MSIARGILYAVHQGRKVAVVAPMIIQSAWALTAAPEVMTKYVLVQPAAHHTLNAARISAAAASKRKPSGSTM